VDLRAGLDDLENRKLLTLPGLELRPLNRPARSQSLYRLRYPGSLKIADKQNLFIFLGEKTNFGISFISPQADAVRTSSYDIHSILSYSYTLLCLL
jgi:hypothetical protein